MQDNDDKLIQILSDIRPPYAWLPYIILDLYGPGMGVSGWLYTILNRFKNSSTSEAKVGERTLATACGIDRGTVGRYALKLEDLGVIKIIPGDRINESTYRILLPPLPPPSEIIEKHFPKGWTPPNRSLKMLKSIHAYLSNGDEPQHMGGQNRGGGIVQPPLPSEPKPAIPGGGTELPPQAGGVDASGLEGGSIAPPGWGQDTPGVVASDRQYKYFNILKTNNNPVVESLFNETLKALKTFDPSIDENDVDLFLCDGLKIKTNPQELKTFIEEKIKVAKEQAGKIGELRSWFRTAIREDYHPKEFFRLKEKQEQEARRQAAALKKQQEAEEYEKQFAAELELRRSKTVEQILEDFRALPSVLEKDRRIRILKTSFEGVNPNWNSALNLIEKEG